MGIGDKQLTKEQKATQVNDPNRNQATDAKGEQEARLNTSNIAYSNNSSDSKNKTLVTLGQGTVTIADDQATEEDSTERLNRDSDKTTKELYSIDRQQGNVDLTIDTRLLTEDGRDEIAEGFLKTSMVTDAISDIIQSEKLTAGDFVSEVQKNHDTYEAVKAEIANDRYIVRSIGSEYRPNW